MKILVAEDEKALARAIVKILEKNHYSADAVYDGEAAVDYLASDNYDAAILDIMMPGTDGITVLKRTRAAGNRVPILILSAKAEVEDRVLGLDSGADDYLPKPFDTRELLARIRTMTRSKDETDSRMTFGNVTLNRATYELSSPFGSFRLANKEYQMMEFLMSNPRRLLSAERFMEKIWGMDSDADANVVRVYISYLRRKLTALHADIRITAARNAGYSLEDADDT